MWLSENTALSLMLHAYTYAIHSQSHPLPAGPQWRCFKGEKVMFPPAKAVVHMERLPLFMRQRERECSLVTESRDEISTEFHFCLFFFPPQAASLALGLMQRHNKLH